MKTLDELTLEDIQQVEKIVNLKLATKSEVRTIQEFGRKFIDNKMQICPHCSGQIRFSWNRVKNFYNHHREFIEDKKESLLNSIPDNLCVVCEAVMQDRRKKFCSPSCKREFKSNK